mmetsp:Transcript_32663/g.81902  ORF Transcript_32663/g.81902 Transcript_32663/m.81902 type:complete len:140 (-) Transcript_32663:1095-1514(-)
MVLAPPGMSSKSQGGAAMPALPITASWFRRAAPSAFLQARLCAYAPPPGGGNHTATLRSPAPAGLLLSLKRLGTGTICPLDAIGPAGLLLVPAFRVVPVIPATLIRFVLFLALPVCATSIALTGFRLPAPIHLCVAGWG